MKKNNYPDYPIHSAAKIYHDIDGNDVTLMQLIEIEPEWAYERIKRCEELEEKMENEKNKSNIT